MKRSTQRGFTLVEMAISCAVAGILSAVALPSYTAQVQKAQRADAYTGLALVQHAQERYRSLHPQYASSLADLGLGSDAAGPRYSLTLTGSSAVGYTVLASSKAQADKACATLQMAVLRGVNTRSASNTAGLDTSSTCFPR
jgi:type IV pilus assembly protein PilE